MPLYFIPLFVIFVFGVYIIVRMNQRKWNDGVLREGEKVIYEQENTVLQSGRLQRTMNNTSRLIFRATNERFFFLFPNKKSIFLILDFTNSKENTATENIHSGTLFIKRENLQKKEKDGKNYIQIETENFMGVNITYVFEVRDFSALKDVV